MKGEARRSIIGEHRQKDRMSGGCPLCLPLIVYL
jgi:hypothetical protein